MTCAQTAHILDLYDSFRSAELDYLRFLDRDLDRAEARRHQKCTSDEEDTTEEHDKLYERIREIRGELMDIVDFESGLASITLMAVNLTITVWHLANIEDIILLPEEGTVFMDDPFIQSPILNAWEIALWLAGLRDDPRFSIETIMSDLSAPPIGDA